MQWLAIQLLTNVQQARPEMKTTGAPFQINNAKIYNPVVTLSISDKTKFL